MNSSLQTGSEPRGNRRRGASRIVLPLVLLAAFPNLAPSADLLPATLRAWNAYVEATESRIASELSSTRGFLALDFQTKADAGAERQAIRSGEITVKKMESFDPRGSRIPVPGGTIHHWRGCVFIAGGNLEEILTRVTNPTTADTRQEDVLSASVLDRGPDSLRIFLKLQRSKFITVVYNTEHAVRVQRHGKGRASSTSVATRIAEVDMPNSDREREKPAGQDRGFLWRMNSYWRYEQVPGGIMVECESITLSRAVPSLLEPLIRPLIESTARESMQRTLLAMRGRMAHAALDRPFPHSGD